MTVVHDDPATFAEDMLEGFLDAHADRVTGVPELGGEAVGTLRAAASALRLRGVHPIFTGIRPAVAIALIADGRQLTDASVCATLQEGIALANRRRVSR